MVNSAHADGPAVGDSWRHAAVRDGQRGGAWRRVAARGGAASAASEYIRAWGLRHKVRLRGPPVGRAPWRKAGDDVGDATNLAAPLWRPASAGLVA